MENPSESPIVYRELDRDGENPAVQVARVVAELDDRDVTAMDDVYGCVDGVLDRLFDDPPSPDAKMTISFDYAGYRVTVRQDGSAEFRRLSSSS